MTFMLSPLPAAAPAPPSGGASRAADRAANTDAAEPESFSQTLARSRQAGQEKVAEPAAKTAPPRPARRPADDEPPAAPGSADPMAALLASAQNNPLAADAQALDPATLPDSALASATGSMQAPALPGTANPVVALADAAGLAADTLSSQGAAAPELLTLLLKEAGPAPAQSRETAARSSLSDPAAAAADPRAVAPSHLAGASLPDPSSGQSGEASRDTAADSGEQAEPLMAAAQDAAPTLGTGLLAAQHTGGLLGTAGPATPAPAPLALLAPDVGSPEWSKALGQQVIHLSAADRQTAELQLNPPGLGPLKVTLSLNDQQMQAAFVSAHASVRAAVETALPQLRAMLAESGISLGQTSVGAESQSQTAFGNAQGDTGGRAPRPGWRGLEAERAALLFSAPSATAQAVPGRGLRINTYA